MVYDIKSWALAFATILIATPALASTVDQTVNDCVYAAGVRGDYKVTPAQIGGVSAFTVPPGADVTPGQSKGINHCIVQALQGKPKPARLAAAVRPQTVDACLADYQHKLRTTRNGRDYRGRNFGARIATGIFRRNLGRSLIEQEYDHCLNRIAYFNNRCPTGAFVGGGSYCIKRPTR